MSPPVSPPTGPPPGQTETICSGTLYAVEVADLRVPSGAFCSLVAGVVVRGNVLVEAGAVGIGFGAGSRVAGNVEAKSGAFTIAVQTTVGGNFKCDRCRFHSAFDLSIGGNLQIIGSRDGFTLTWSAIGGNLEMIESVGANVGLMVADSTIGGDLKVEKNVGVLRILTNTVLGELQIVENRLGSLTCSQFQCVSPQHVFSNNLVRGNMQVLKNRGPAVITSNQIEANLQCQANDPAPSVAGNTARAREGQCAGS